MIGQCKGNDLLLEMAEAQAGGYDSDSSIDTEEWQQLRAQNAKRRAVAISKSADAAGDYSNKSQVGLRRPYI